MVNWKRILLVGVAAVALYGCGNDDQLGPGPVFDPNNPNAYVNDWILDRMDFWYFWREDIPTETDNSIYPGDYFRGILSDQDRFSWIQEDYQELLNLLGGVELETGHELRYLLDSDTTAAAYAQVLYVKDRSPSEEAGMQRGDLITHVNGVELSVSNFRELRGQMSEPHDLQFLRYNFDSEQYESGGSADITPEVYSESPHFLDTIYAIENLKVGYYVYNHFATSPGSTDGEIYLEVMDKIFAEFKSQRIDELIVDLRYNQGGAITSAINLASLISGAGSSETLITRQYHSILQDLLLNDPSFGTDFINEEFIFKTEAVSLPRVYFITGYRTASASELVINGLDPHMEVIQVGDFTVGKNQGSISLFEEDDPNNRWGMQPIVLKFANSAGDSDFESGIAPTIFDEDLVRVMYPLGDIRENLLSRTIEAIVGPGAGRIRQERAYEPLDDNVRALPVHMDDEKTAKMIEKFSR